MSDKSDKNVREAKIHFELHHHLQNTIKTEANLHGITFARSEPEYIKD